MNPKKGNPQPARKAVPPPPEDSHALRMGMWLAAAWAAFIVFRYLQQTPLQMDVFESILPSQTFFPKISALVFYAWSLTLWLGILAVCFTVGRFLIRPARPRWHSNLEEAVFTLATGLGAVGLLVLGLAAAHLLSKPLFFALWLAGVGAFAALWTADSAVPSLIKNAAGQSRELLFGNESPFLVRFFVWALLALSFMMAFVPELFYDALVYHMGVPNLFLQEGGLVRVPGVLSKVPMIWQSLYLFGLAVNDEMVPKLLHWTAGFLIVLACGALSQRLNRPKAGLWAGLLFLSVPMVQMNVWTTGIDIGGCLFAFLSLYALISWTQTQESEQGPADGWIAVSALFAGYVFGSKYQGGIVGASGFFILCAIQWRDILSNPVPVLRRAALYLGVAGAVALPWLLKNLWDVGNPLFPFLSNIFTQLGWQKVQMDPEQWKVFIGENRRFITSTWAEHWQLPWKLTFSDRNQSSLSYPGPMFLAFLPLSLAALRSIRERWMQITIVFLVLFFAFSFSSTHLTRYHLQGYPLLCFFFAVGIVSAWDLKDAFLRWAVIATATFAALANLQTNLYVIATAYRPWAVLSGQEKREDYRAYTHPGLNPYPSNIMFRWMEQNLPAKARILFVGESKTFDLKRPYLFSDVHGLNPLTTWSTEAASPEDLYGKFTAAGITHIYINFDEARRTYGYKMLQWEPARLELFKQFWSGHVREVHVEKIPERLFPPNSVLLLYEVLPQEAAQARGPAPVNPVAMIEEMNSKKK